MPEATSSAGQGGTAERDRAVAAALLAFGKLARAQGRRSSAIAGVDVLVLGLWAHLKNHWPPPREIRSHQPSMAISHDPDMLPDPLVRQTRPTDLDTLLPACVAMFTEEVGYSPAAGPGTVYRERMRGLIRDGRSFARFATPPISDPFALPQGPPVVFKAELGAVMCGPSPEQSVAQVQGVWIEPTLRGRGLAVPGMAAVVRHARRQGFGTVSLYVNGYNQRAIDTYRKVGFTQRGTFATIHF